MGINIRLLTLFWGVIYQAGHDLWFPQNRGWEIFAQLQKFRVKFGKFKICLFHPKSISYKSYLPRQTNIRGTWGCRVRGTCQYQQSWGWNSVNKKQIITNIQIYCNFFMQIISSYEINVQNKFIFSGPSPLQLCPS